MKKCLVILFAVVILVLGFVVACDGTVNEELASRLKFTVEYLEETLPYIEVSYKEETFGDWIEKKVVKTTVLYKMDEGGNEFKAWSDFVFSFMFDDDDKLQMRSDLTISDFERTGSQQEQPEVLFIEYGGVPVKKGDTVQLLLIASNDQKLLRCRAANC